MKLSIFNRLLYVLFLILTVSMSIAFRTTSGLVTGLVDSQMIYVIDYLSSGSDDNVIIEASFLLYIIPIVITLLRISKPFVIWEYFVSVFAFIFQFIFLFSLELGSITKTILLDHNYILLFWCIGLLGAFLMLNIEFFMVNIRSNLLKKPLR